MSRHYKNALYDIATGESVSTGGTVVVCTAGSPAKATLVDENGASLSNPVTISEGVFEFYTADGVESVDIYGLAGNGVFFKRSGVGQGSAGAIMIEVGKTDNVLVAPFHPDDYTANTETDSGFDLSTNMVITGFPALKVATIDTSETIDVGTDAGGGNDPNGFIAALSVATAGVFEASNATGDDNLGALLLEDALQHDYAIATAADLTYTLSAGSDTAAGYIYLPYRNLDD